MTGWWITMGCLLVACLALVPSYTRRRARRVQVAQIRALVDDLNLRPKPPTGTGFGSCPVGPKQPDGSGVDGETPPTAASAACPDLGGAVRRRRRVGPGDPRLLGPALSPERRVS